MALVTVTVDDQLLAEAQLLATANSTTVEDHLGGVVASYLLGHVKQRMTMFVASNDLPGLRPYLDLKSQIDASVVSVVEENAVIEEK